MVEEQRANKSNNYEVRIIGIYAMPSLPILPGGGGTAIYGLYRYVRCEGYGFQVVYSGIGYINQGVGV